MHLAETAEGALPPSAASPTLPAPAAAPVPALPAEAPLLPTVAAQPSPHIHGNGPWISGRLFSVVPPNPLAPITDLDETWYVVTKGRYVGVTPDNALDGAATVRVSGAGHKGYSTQASALAAFNRALAVVPCLMPFCVYFPLNYIPYIYPYLIIFTPNRLVALIVEFMRLIRAPMPVVDRLVLIYPTTETLRHIFTLAMKDPPTLSESDLLDSLLGSPNTCDRCPKPHFKHAAIPDATFTIMIRCPHNPDPDYPDSRNKAVAKILPENRQHQACLGHLLVFKHAIVDDLQLSNAHLPVIDMAPSDLPFLDELVRRWVVHLHGLSASAAATSSAGSSSLPSVATSLPQLRIFPSPSMVAPTPTPPVYDIDEIFASLTLEERAEYDVWQRMALFLVANDHPSSGLYRDTTSRFCASYAHRTTPTPIKSLFQQSHLLALFFISHCL
ncbi:hypothetical protein B0H16DRAFT_1733432 [Mycena metata]|uniref:Uncharacterized protein n=1 Tax=Mycena metata TaxID=1033252 RepID=A0AAD7MT99_9AGAR|nr:hypothetical protein B0H16DRAFT_1733432 [Mycena metata]